MRTSGVLLGCAGGVAAAALALSGCSSSSNTKPTSSPSPTSSSASPTSQAMTKTIGDWELTLNSASTPPAGWPKSIPVPAGGNLVATGTAEPTKTTADHPVMAVKYLAPGTVGSMSTAMMKACQSAGWKEMMMTGEFPYMSFEKGNESMMMTIEADGSTGGVAVYQWT